MTREQDEYTVGLANQQGPHRVADSKGRGNTVSV